MKSDFCVMQPESDRNNRKEAFRNVLLAFMEEMDLSQRKIAEKIGSKPANFNKRIIAGSMRPDMIMKINEVFGIDLLGMVTKYQAGESLKEIIAEVKGEKLTTKVELELSPEEVKEVLLNQQKTQEELAEQFNTLVGQIKTWITHDQERMRKQDEIIHMLLEERAEYKAKKKN